MSQLPFTSSNEHLMLELSRVQTLFELRVRAQMGFQPQQDQLGFSGALSIDEIERLLQLGRMPDAVHIAAQQVPQSFESVFEKAKLLAEETATRRQASVAAGIDLSLNRLCRTCLLTPTEQDIILLLLLSTLFSNVNPLFAYLNQKRNCDWPTAEAISGILASTLSEFHTFRAFFTPQSKLMRLGLILAHETDVEPFRQRIQLAPTVVSILLGQIQLSAPLSQVATLTGSNRSLDSLMLPTVEASKLVNLLERYRKSLLQSQTDHSPGHSLIIALDGLSLADRHYVAEGIAKQFNHPLLTLHLASLIGKNGFEQGLKSGLLWARAAGIPLYFSGCQSLGNATDEQRLIWQQQITSSSGCILLDQIPPQLPTGPQPSIVTVPLGKRDYPVLLNLWHEALKRAPIGPDVDPAALANVYRLDLSQVQAAVSWALASALLNCGDEPPLVTQSDLQRGARLQTDGPLAEQAELIKIEHSWEDLILPEATINQLQEIYLRIKHRARVHEIWGLSKKVLAKRGLSVLFAGPSGTGKTLAAGIIAQGLGQDLYRVDLSTLVSKYIGETEKNLNKVFDAAEQSSATLFFDEADAIFGKRSDVKDSHDRYANLQVAYLLQRMESFSGMAILATNLIANTDDAFIRRLDFIVTFPEPGPAEREKIWKHHLSSSGKLPLGEIDFQFLGRQFEMTGGLIRNAVVHAAFLAAEDGENVGMRHLLQAVRREYQKQRRLIDESGFAQFT